jgi:hypothetical protein
MPTKLPAISILFGAVAFSGVVAVSPRQDVSPVCRGPDSFSTAQIARLQELMASRDPRDSAFVQSVHLHHVPSNGIQLVTADSLCVLAAAAWTGVDTVTTPPVTRLYVIRVGSMYDVIDRQQSGGEYSQHIVLDSAFHYQGPYLF